MPLARGTGALPSPGQPGGATPSPVPANGRVRPRSLPPLPSRPRPPGRAARSPPVEWGGVPAHLLKSRISLRRAGVDMMAAGKKVRGRSTAAASLRLLHKQPAMAPPSAGGGPRRWAGRGRGGPAPFVPPPAIRRDWGALVLGLINGFLPRSVRRPRCSSPAQTLRSEVSAQDSGKAWCGEGTSLPKRFGDKKLSFPGHDDTMRCEKWFPPCSPLLRVRPPPHITHTFSFYIPLLLLQRYTVYI